VAPRDGAVEGGFEQLDERELFAGWTIRLVQARFRAPDGSEFERDVIRHPGAVAVVPVDEDGVVTLVRQFRASRGTTVLEVPAGTCDVAGEAAEHTGRRELAEEAGLEAATMQLLAEIYNSPGYSDQRTALYLATGLRPCPPAPAGIEERWLTTEQVALGAVPELIAAGVLHDATTITALLLAREALGRPAS
jgi:8-oxo-dGTP pyrophosphatase MutT (NUDIX family)